MFGPNTAFTPKNEGGATPIIVTGTLLIRSIRLRMRSSPPNLVCDVA